MTTIKKTVKKEVWGSKLDKDLADFKKKVLKNGNVSMCIVTTDSKNETHTMILNHSGSSMVFTAAFLKGMEKASNEGLKMGILKWMSDK